MHCNIGYRCITELLSRVSIYLWLLELDNFWCARIVPIMEFKNRVSVPNFIEFLCHYFTHHLFFLSSEIQGKTTILWEKRGKYFTWKCAFIMNRKFC